MERIFWPTRFDRDLCMPIVEWARSSAEPLLISVFQRDQSGKMDMYMTAAAIKMPQMAPQDKT